jgi:flagellar FliL protein
MAAGATKAETKAEPDAAPQPEKGKSKKLLMIGAIVAALAIGGGGAYFFTRKPPADDTVAEEKAPGKSAEKTPGKAKEKEKGPHKAMLYVPMETFTVNLRHADQERYLQVTINLEVVDSVIGEAIKQQMPSMRNRVLLLLSSQDAENLMTREGKEKLSSEISAELRKSLDGTGPNKGLEQVLFSHFVIQ